MPKTKTKREPAPKTGPRVVRTYEVVLFPVLNGTPAPDLEHDPVEVRLSYKVGQEPLDRAGAEAIAEATALAARRERKAFNVPKSTYFEAASVTPIRESLLQ